HLRRGEYGPDGREPHGSQREEVLHDAPPDRRADARAKRELLMPVAKGEARRAKGEAASRPSQSLSRDQLLELYYWMRFTRTLEERLVALYRQTKVVG